MADLETKGILALWQSAARSCEESLLATVVAVEGSSYRLPGARLLLTPDGRRAGSVSGGCLEDDLIQKARWLTRKGPVVRCYRTTPDDAIVDQADAVVPHQSFALGCNGTIYISLERISGQRPCALDTIAGVVRTRVPATVVHRLACAGLPDFVELFTPPIRLLVFGAGDDAIPLCRFARLLGWTIELFDGRAHYARAERHPDADRVELRKAGDLTQIVFDPWTVAVLMSHSLAQDTLNLQALLAIDLPYIGVLGPKHRTEQLTSQIPDFDARVASQLFSPMGLDLGAEGPEQVALATTAEILSVLRRRDGGQLRHRAGSIHQCA